MSLWPYILLFIATFIEGPIALLTAGATISLGKIDPLYAFIAVTTGNLSADLGWYTLGRLGKMEWIKWFASKFKIDLKAIDRLGETVKDYAPRLVFFSKFTVGLPIPTLISVGLERIPMRRWLPFGIIGEFIKSSLFMGAGYLFAQAIQQTYGTLQVVTLDRDDNNGCGCFHPF